jgi:hypothetical protein
MFCFHTAEGGDGRWIADRCAMGAICVMPAGGSAMCVPVDAGADMARDY